MQKNISAPLTDLVDTSLTLPCIRDIGLNLNWRKFARFYMKNRPNPCNS